MVLVPSRVTETKKLQPAPKDWSWTLKGVSWRHFEDRFPTPLRHTDSFTRNHWRVLGILRAKPRRIFRITSEMTLSTSTSTPSFWGVENPPPKKEQVKTRHEKIHWQHLQRCGKVVLPAIKVIFPIPEKIGLKCGHKIIP